MVVVSRVVFRWPAVNFWLGWGPAPAAKAKHTEINCE